MSKNYDIAIIGAGPGGYVAAIRAAQLGFKVVVVEKENLGGICLNWGCIPTKALLTSASVFNYAKNANKYGVDVSSPKADLTAMVQRSRKVSAQLVSGITSLFKKNKIDTIFGTAVLKNSTTILVNTKEQTKETITAKHIILATGARARIIPGIEPDGDLILTYREALAIKRMPKELIVMGSGAIGIEFAYFFSTLGAKVTVIEMQKQIMPSEDKEIADLALKSFTKHGINFYIDTKVKKVEKSSNSVKVYLETADGTEKIINGDTFISAAGVVPNVENIGLENTKVKLQNGRPVVNEWLQTTDHNIYAIGDLVNGPWLAHKASHEGIICVEKIANLPNVHKLNTRMIPGCIYTHPQVASVGLKEEDAKKLGYDVKVGRFPLIANGKSIALGESEGLIKTIFDSKTGELLGAHMIGPEVTEMIQGYTIGMNLETTEKELINTIFPHPTISESMHEAILAAFGRAIHF
ncbi:UNVERIFIED_CONTAM: hypothetical protein PYX00_011085 [Menopon gallinae]|uniref:Dihydrolipoyl dehydrogenase n=1 Tax=Menopon gallinae TaxID=328185 RepID=A0AAW2H638_9NEOP